MKIFLFYFEMAIKITGSAQNYRVGRVSGNTPTFLGPITIFLTINVFSTHTTRVVRKVRGHLRLKPQMCLILYPLLYFIKVTYYDYFEIIYEQT